MTLAIEIEEQIEQGYLQKDWRVFFAEQFESLATRGADALKALMQLASQGKLTAIVELRCNEGHTVWSDVFRKRLDRHECQECEERGNIASDSFVRFELAERWLQTLDSKKKARS
jgi:hypothetical protein